MKNRVISFLLFFVMLAGTFGFTILCVSGTEGDGITFDAANIYEAPERTDRTPTTFEAWIKLPKSAASGRGGVIFGNYGDTTSPCISFEIHNGGNPRLYWLGSTSSDLADCKFTDVNVCTGEWLHLAIVRDKTKRNIHCYINGELASTMALPLKAVRNMICVEPFVVGGDLRNGNGQYFKGSIRSVAIYDSARTAAEIKKDMESPEICDSLISYYDLTKGLNDLSGNGYDLTHHSAIVWIPASQKEEIADFDYTFAVVGDTQTVANKTPEKFHLIYDWIIDNKEKKNIQFVMGLGDITDQSLDREWNLAMTNILRLKDAGIPFSLTRGNHDTVETFNKNYSYSEYSSSVEGTFDETMLNSWQKFSVGNRKYIVFALDFGPSDRVLAWAEEIITAHPDHNVIITTHSYLYRDGTTLDASDLYPPTSGNTGDHMWEKLIKKHENIVLVLSGHDPVGRIIMAQNEGDNGNTVTQMLVDFQYEDANQGGLGIVTLLHFSEDSDEIQVETYSTAKKQYYKPKNQFTLTLDFVGEDPIDESPVESEESSQPFEDSELTTVPEESETPRIESSTELIADTDTTVDDSVKGDNAKDENSSNNTIIIVGISSAAVLTLTSTVIIVIIKKKKT